MRGRDLPDHDTKTQKRIFSLLNTLPSNEKAPACSGSFGRVIYKEADNADQSNGAFTFLLLTLANQNAASWACDKPEHSSHK